MNLSPVAAQRSIENQRLALLFFFCWPFLGLILGSGNLRTTYAKNILWLFAIFYGYTFVLTDDGLDADRYRDALVTLHGSESSLSDLLASMYTDQYIDVLQPLITFLVSRVTDDYRILFACFGVVFGYFFSRNVSLIVRLGGRQLTFLGSTIFILFIFLVPIWQINGFRMWTAAHIFVYFYLRYTVSGERKHLFATLLASLVHFSFILPFTLLLLYSFMGSRINVYFICFLLSFFVSNLSVDFETIMPDVPIVFQERVEAYTNNDWIERYSASQESTNWYIKYRGIVIRYALFLLMTYIFLFYQRTIKASPLLLKLASFSFLFSAVANCLLSHPSPTFGRFILLVLLILCVTLFVFFQMKRNSFDQAFKIMLSLLVCFYVIVEVRIGLDTIGLATLFANPVTAPFFSNDLPIINLIK